MIETGKQKHPGGRPKLFESVEELKSKIKEYFDFKTCPDKRMVTLKSFEEGEKGEYVDYVPHFTKTGLALHLGFESRQSLYDYAKLSEKEDATDLDKEFSYIIKRATLRVENNYERMLAEKGVQTGAIFALKNMGWKDRTEVEQTGTSTQIVVNNNKDAEALDELSSK